MSLSTLEHDQETFDGYVAAQLLIFENEERADVWNTEKFRLARVAGDPVPVDTRDAGAFVGPWHVVRTFVSDEFKVWCEGGMRKRFTFAEWQQNRIKDRVLENARAEENTLDTAAYFMRELNEIREAAARRDSFILGARSHGVTYAQLIVATGISRAQLDNIVNGRRSKPAFDPDAAF
jgi:hypothetical protein